MFFIQKIRPFTAGLGDVSTYPELFDLLAENGWTRSELRKLAGLNIIRVMRDVELASFRLKRDGMKPIEKQLPLADMIAANATLSCRTDIPADEL